MRVEIWQAFWVGCVMLLLGNNSSGQSTVSENGDAQSSFYQYQHFPLTNATILLNRPKWNLSLGAGLMRGPYVSQLKDAFKDLGLLGCYDTFFGQECYPKEKLAIGFTAALSRDVNKHFSIGITATRSIIYGIEGFNRGITASIGNRIFTIAPMVHYTLKDYVVFGAGPAYHNMKVRFSNIESADVVATNFFARWGFLAEMAVIYPTEGVAYGKVNLRYHYTGEVEVGPYLINQQMEFPKSEISFNPILFTIGFGLRL